MVTMASTKHLVVQLEEKDIPGVCLAYNDIEEYTKTQLQRWLQCSALQVDGTKPTLINTYTARPVCWSGWISDSYCTLKPLCSGMGEVVPARTSPTLVPPSPRTVLSLPCFKVSQCINCRDWHFKG